MKGFLQTRKREKGDKSHKCFLGGNIRKGFSHRNGIQKDQLLVNFKKELGVLGEGQHLNECNGPLNRFVKGVRGRDPEEATRRGCPEACGAGRKQLFPGHTPSAKHYPRKTWDPLWGWAPRLAELIPCQLRPTVTRFPHPLKDWDDDGNPKMKEDAQRQDPFFLPEQRGQIGTKSQTRSRAPVPPAPQAPGTLFPSWLCCLLLTCLFKVRLLPGSG